VARAEKCMWDIGEWYAGVKGEYNKGNCELYSSKGDKLLREICEEVGVDNTCELAYHYLQRCIIKSFCIYLWRV